MSGVILPCGSRRPGHRHCLEWGTGEVGSLVEADHTLPELWIWLAHLELERAAGRVSTVILDGAEWQPNPRDGWNALALLRQASDRGHCAATQMLDKHEQEMTRWENR